MKVIHFYKTYYPDTHGGMEEAIRQLCLQTSKRGVSNTVVTISKSVTEPEVLERPECTLIRFPMTFDVASTPFSWKLFRAFRSLAADADLIHHHYPWPVADVMQLLSGVKKPYMITYQSDIVKQKFLRVFYAPFEAFFLRKAELITVASPPYMKSSKTLSKYLDKCHLMELGLDISSFPEVDAARRKSWEDKVGTDFFLFVGVLRYYKGLEYLVKALQGTDLKVVIVGDGPMREALHQEAKKLGVLNQIVFTGFLPNEDKVCLYSLCLAFVFPSHLRSEAYGVSLLEAAAFGCGLISCEINTGTSYINQDKETGIVVPPAQPSALRLAMETLVNNSQLAKTYGEAARQRYENVFKADKMAETCIQLYKQVLEK